MVVAIERYGVRERLRMFRSLGFTLFHFVARAHGAMVAVASVCGPIYLYQFRVPNLGMPLFGSVGSGSLDQF